MTSTDTTSNPGRDEKVAFGARLRAARIKRGLTQAQLATACGVGANIPTTWESGERAPGGQVPWLLCQVLGYEEWAGLWGEVSETRTPGMRLVSDNELDALAQQRAAEILADVAKRMT